MQQLLLGGTQPMSSHAQQVPCDIVDGKDRWACAADLKRRMIGQPLEAPSCFRYFLMRLFLFEVSCTCCEIRDVDGNGGNGDACGIRGAHSLEAGILRKACANK